jgi:Yip1-like protein
MDVPRPPPPPAPAVAKPNPFQRIAGVLIAPSETFASIARQPDWVVPLVLMLVLSLIGGVIFAQRIDIGSTIRQSIEERGNMPPDAAERAVRFGTAFAKVAFYCAPIFTAITFVIIAAVFLLVFRLFGSENDFRQAFSVTLYGWMPQFIRNVIMVIVVLARSGIDAAQLPILVRSNLAFLVDMKAQPLAFAALSSLDAFTIWTLILYIIGFASISKFSRAKSSAIVISLWAVAVLFKLIPAAIRALRA